MKCTLCIAIRKTRNTDDFLGSGTKLLLPSLSVGFRHEERERHNFSMLTIRPSSALNPLTQSTRVRTPAVHKLHWPRPSLKNELASTKFKSNSKSLRIPGHRFRAWRHSHPQSYFLPGVFIVTSVIVTYSPHARKPALMSAPTHALSRKVLILTKPKDKIYKTKNDNIKKSFRNYTTQSEVFIKACRSCYVKKTD